MAGAPEHSGFQIEARCHSGTLLSSPGQLPFPSHILNLHPHPGLQCHLLPPHSQQMVLPPTAVKKIGLSGWYDSAAHLPSTIPPLPHTLICVQLHHLPPGSEHRLTEATASTCVLQAQSLESPLGPHLSVTSFYWISSRTPLPFNGHPPHQRQPAPVPTSNLVHFGLSTI